jgi:phosphoserine phosphatase
MTTTCLLTIPRFRAVVLDVDSTLSGIEGIDWLAARRGPEVAQEIARLTERAMAGEIALDSIYGGRLELVRPSAAEIAALGRAYVEAVAPGAREAVFRMRGEGVALAIVSGGIRQAIAPLARELGFDERDVHAVALSFDGEGGYASYDAASPLASQRGKKDVVATLELPRPSLAVGDGATDVAMRDAADAFAAFTGFARRQHVVRAADYVVSSFDELTALVLP